MVKTILQGGPVQWGWITVRRDLFGKRRAHESIWVGIVAKARAYVLVFIRAKSSGNAHSIELRKRTRIGEDYRRDILGFRLIKKPGTDFFVAILMLADFLRHDDELTVFHLPIDAKAIQIMPKR